jgi:hypothetical protein
MKATGCVFSRVLAVLLGPLPFAASAAVVFTTNTVIHSFETNYDGADIIVSNCTVTVDGSHQFQSLLVGGGGIITHTPSGSAMLFEQRSVLDEPQVLTSTSPVSLLVTGALETISVSDTNLNLFTLNQDYVVTQGPNWTIEVQRTAGSAIPDGATVLVSYTVLDSTAAGLWLTVSGDATVSGGGAINVNGGGYSGGSGTGAGHTAGAVFDGSGGGYGGIGGTSSSNAVGGITYGAFDVPSVLGSGGGTGVGGLGAAGGGLIHLAVGGTLTIDGLVTANGGDALNERAGGGSGGSIWLSAGAVTGAGALTADGGAGEPVHGGGGGGGRIALSCGTNHFAGAITAYGGPGWQAGGAGTVYSVTVGQSGMLVLDNGGQSGTNTTLTVVGAPNVLIQGNAKVLALGPWTVNNLTLASNGWLLALPLTTLNLTAENVTIQPGGGILADGAGNGPGYGQGAGGYAMQSPSFPCGGGGYGGFGGSFVVSNSAGGIVYGSQNAPTSFGSGGGGYTPNQGTSLSGYGGGALHLTIVGTLQVDGLLSASGTAGSGTGGGGGSGGSLWISAGVLAGVGGIAANGGTGVDHIGGGGGGGRIAVFPALNSFNGVISAYGGSGANYGGAGTVYIQSGNSTQLILDNGGPRGANTAIQNANSADLIVRNGAVGVQTYPPQTFQNLLIGSNGWLTASTPGGNYLGQVNLVIEGNATIQPGGGIITDAMGYGGGLGPGAGRVSFVSPNYYLAGGGGHGGYGGGGIFGGFAGEDPIDLPRSLGSGGGQSLPNLVGGAGGGSIRLIGRNLQMDGIISANGGNGSGLGGGGGAGGSVWLTFGGTLSGSGLISANGGNGAPNSLAGGGGGGCIAVSSGTNVFHGLLSAYGGGLSTWGGAGTILTNSYGVAELLLDNGGHPGANSVFNNTTENNMPIDATVMGGAVAQIPGSWNVRNLLVQSNSMVVLPARSYQLVGLIASGNVTVETGGAISADGAGYDYSNRGPGGGYSSTSGIRGGGGHGGWGGANPLGPSRGGGAYDFIQSPSLAGSAGGSYGNSASTAGGAGGGALRINVIGVLTINGRLSADGLDGAPDSGGGAGGALSINAGTLAGSGTISANGGAGLVNGGGGGGGRIYLTYRSPSQFTGPVLALGGNGIVPGGAGTVFVMPSGANIGQLIIDNGGLTGTNTPFSSAYVTQPQLPPFDLTISGGATLQSLTPLPMLNSLIVKAGSSVVGSPGQTNLQLIVVGNADIAPGASVSANGCGFPQRQGPGAGTSLNSQGAGGGYGGPGGGSVSGAAGGITYGSDRQPTDWGSGGGAGANTFFGGSEGGGAIRMSIGGTLTADGVLSANGNPGLQDNSGGGSGGSIWVSARAFTGKGWVSANGGSGELYNGGGGGGGRVAIYSPANTYTGVVFIAGGPGANPGESGSLVEGDISPLQVIAQSPAGTTNDSVSTVDLTFNEFVNTFSAAGFTLNTPSGPLSNSNVTALAVGPATLRFSFPSQDQVGSYAIELSSGVTSVLGQTLEQAYTGAFTITVPNFAPRLNASVINGNVGATWQGLAGVAYQGWWSTNLVDWQPLGGLLYGSNALLQLQLPTNGAPAGFLRVQAND